MSDDRIFAKCAWRLLPLLTLLFFVNLLDRVNVGFAALTMNRDLGFSPSVYGFGAGIFFLGYSTAGIPSTLLLERVGARRGLFGILALWGLISAACATTQGGASFYVLRFLLGVAEAGFFPGVILYMSLWFPQSWRAKAIAMFMVAGPVSNCIGGPISAYLLEMNGILGLHGWQWLFLLEGFPAFVLAFVTVRVLPDGPMDARWLNPDQKQMVVHRLASEVQPADYSFWPALRDPGVLALAVAYFGFELSIYGFNLWLPQIVRQMGFSILATGLVVAAIWAVTAVGQVLSARSSDAHGERVWHIAVPIMIAAAAWVAAAGLGATVLPALIALAIVRCGINASYGAFWSLSTELRGGPAAGGGIAFIVSLSALGGFVGPAVMGVLRQATGTYAAGMLFLASGLVISAAIVVILGRSTEPHAEELPIAAH